MPIPPILTDPTRRYDLVLLLDVTDGNPNGDPDADNLPRMDPLTQQGLISDVALKRRIRDYVQLTQAGVAGRAIVVQSGTALHTQQQRAYTALGLTTTGSKQAAADVARARAWMCQAYYDIRMFGAVMSTGMNCGQVRGIIMDN